MEVVRTFLLGLHPSRAHVVAISQANGKVRDNRAGEECRLGVVKYEIVSTRPVRSQIYARPGGASVRSLALETAFDVRREAAGEGRRRHLFGWNCGEVVGHIKLRNWLRKRGYIG